MRQFPIRLADDELGVLIVDAGPLRRMAADRRQELTDVGDLRGSVLDLIRTQYRLEASRQAARALAERIAATRRQAFAERDQERRDLERDLHDGAQHHLVALRMVLGLLDVQLAERTLLSTAAGNCPPVLLERGLVAALAADVADLPQRVDLRAVPDGRRFPLAVETAVYFTCLEAVNNARKHAPGAQVVVRITADSRGLAFAVSDDGPGLDQQDPVDSFGLGNMRTRIEATGGTLELRTAPGAGTTIEGYVPL